METADNDKKPEAAPEESGFEVTTQDVVVPEPEKKPEAEDDKSKPEPKGEGEDKAKAESSEADKAKNDTPDDDGASRRKNRTQKRIDKLTKRAAEAERRARDAEAKLAEKDDGKKKPDAQAKEPNAADYEDYNEYLPDLAAFNESQDDDGKKAEPAPKKSDEEAKPDDNPEFRDALEDVTDAFEEAAKDYDDFDDVVRSDDLQITEDMVIALAETDDPAGIAYHLGKHTDEAARIAALTPRQQLREIAKLEVKLADKKPAPSKKTTAAPEPVEPVRGAGDPKKDLQDMDFKEYEKTRNEQETKRSGSFW